MVYDNLSRGFRDSVQWGPLVVGDLFNSDLLVKTLVDYQIEAVIHFAAFAYIKESVEKPELYFENNLYGSAFLLLALKEVGIKKLVFSSTCATYGEPTQEVIEEDHPQIPINPYGLSKLMVEKILEKSSLTEDLKYCALRYFNAGGADPDMDIGEKHDPEPHIIPRLIRAALDGEKAKIQGGDYPTPDGTCVRDFIHVNDLALAHIAVTEALLKDQNISQFYNLGTGSGFSLLQLVEKISAATGKKLEYEIVERRPGDPSKLVASANLFIKETNWRPKSSDLETIINSALQWELKTRNQK